MVLSIGGMQKYVRTGSLYLHTAVAECSNVNIDDVINICEMRASAPHSVTNPTALSITPCASCPERKMVTSDAACGALETLQCQLRLLSMNNALPVPLVN
jgi:hypothetical protein